MEAAEKKFSRTRGVGGTTNTRTQQERHSRRLENHTQLVQELPNNSEGNNGDVVLFQNKSNYNIIEQFIKTNGEWINITKGRPLNDSPSVKKWIKAKVG